MEPLELNTSQQFEIERLTRTLDQTTDAATLREMAKLLLRAWQGQVAATRWAIRQQTKPVGMGAEWRS